MKQSHTITFQPSGVRIQCPPDQSIAEAALEQGVIVPVSCENGVCQICQAERLSGDFNFRNELGETILEHDNQVLCCVAYPQSDAEISMSDVFAPYHKPELTLACQVAGVMPLPGSVYRVELLAPAGKKVDFWPGQYLMLEVETREGKQQLPYSIACAPGTDDDNRRIELHIAANGETADDVIRYLQQAVIVRVTLPFGDCFIQPDFVRQHSAAPVLMVAAGSGFSQIKSLIEGYLRWNPQQEIHLYWSNKASDAFYLSEQPLAWAEAFANFHYHPIIEQHSDGWHGRAGWIYQVIHEDFTDLSQIQMFACGSPNMVYSTLDQLEPLGLSQNNMHSDVFAYAPRG